MRLLVTGAAGFLGSHVCEYFAKRGWQVRGVDNMTRHELSRTGYDASAARAYMRCLLQDEWQIDFHVGDIKDVGLVDRWTDGCDYIVHCAAQPTITLGEAERRRDIDTNVIGTENVMTAAWKRGIPVVNCSTIHIYGNGINSELVESNGALCRVPPAIDESHAILTGTVTQLHRSKLYGELACRERYQAGLPAANFRLSGMYGPRQFGGPHHGWMAFLAIRTVMGWPISIYRPETQVRDMLYVTDAVRAFDSWFHFQTPGDYNIGGGLSARVTIRKSLELMHEMVGRKLVVEYLPSRPFDLWYFCCDTRKALQDFGWYPKVSIRQGLRKLIDWIQANRHFFEVKGDVDHA